MNNRLWIIASVLVMVLVVAGTAFLGVKPQLDAAAQAASDKAGVEQSNLQLQAEIEELKVKFGNLEELEAELATLRVAVPDDPYLDDYVRFLYDAEKKSGARITSGVVTEPTLYVPSVEYAENLPAGLDTANLFTLGIQLSAEGSRKEVLDFLQRIQKSPRFFLVYNVALSRDDDGIWTVANTGYLFMLRNADGQLDPVTEEEGAEPTPTPTETPTLPGSTPTPTETPAP